VQRRKRLRLGSRR
jgi:hypothetical protein